MASLGDFSDLKEKYSQTADFVTIYIAEAHPYESGHFSDNYSIVTHPHLEARLEAARTLRQEAGDLLASCPILVDPMDDRANLAYVGFPERLYVIKDGKVVFVGGPGPQLYDVKEVDKFLANIS